MEQGESRDVIIRKKIYLSGSFHHDSVIVVGENIKARIGLHALVEVKKEREHLEGFLYIKKFRISWILWFI